MLCNRLTKFIQLQLQGRSKPKKLNYLVNLPRNGRVLVKLGVPQAFTILSWHTGCKLTHQDMLGYYTWIFGRSLQDKDVHDLMGLDCCTGVFGSALLLHKKQNIGSMFATDPSFHPLKKERMKKATFHFKGFRLHQ